ncbi:hypothetical protein TOPH_00681 [Tolypocladium ophioglossoides CBS 100239]|uniref:Uncharacterized protein n=1 Tax=Tolypocladium ophioglossoides (strain CBS 100239) TaxID=1163406 RepID=A0A0L0NM64_TOLOC|nr:hypothetical protein TOPH_00681 [Tolypocladium ophioglossoides CBS 100239]
MPSKKDKKHAKESGGIAAAVTKQAAGKFSNGHISSSNINSPKSGPASDASSPPAITPEIRPSLPEHDKHAASPLLEALSTTSISASTAPSMANEWARGGAFMAGSPGNLINLTSESPPTQPSSYEDSGRLHHGWAAQRLFMSPSPASPSPPHSNRRPLSFQMDAQYHIPGTPPRAASTAAYRRSSLHSQYPNSRASPHPPLPHQPQAHFYGAQDLDLTITPQSGGMKAGGHGLFFGLDRLPPADNSAGSDNVVLAGYEGGLQVYAVGKRGLDLVASLKGLRGGVHYAKILPWTVSGKNDALFPLVAVVVHGPVLPQRATDVGAAADTASDVTSSPRQGFAQPEGFEARPSPVLLSYQTAVEVYSLKTNKLVDVLLQTQKVPINTEVSLSSPLFRPPPPAGAFAIEADVGTIAICSGVTGECWVYRQLLEAQNAHLFACSGKLWTTLQHSHRGEVTEESNKMHPSATPLRPSPQIPIFALNGRWLAYCPAAPSSQISLRAHLPVPILGRAPGVSSLTPPHLPPVSSSVDQPISDSMVNKIMRETTQELIQGAKWVGQQGLHAWNSYWNKPSSPQSQQQQARSPPQHWAGSRSPQTDAAQFLPTHGTAAQAAVKEPGRVSVLDMETLANSPSIHPLTTFESPLGCSFMAFSPSSLALFTASTKGDVQTVWDLMRAQHTHSSPLQTTLSRNDSSGPQVRQIAQFVRMTATRIVDVAWTEPQGERLAVVTERGTVHLLDMPFSSFMWPAPRRRKVASKSVAETSEASSSAVSIASGAFGAAYQAARPFVTRSRRSSANIPATPANTLRDSAAQGGRAIAASISHSLGKTGTAINQLRHTGENRVSLPPSAASPSAACATWLKSRKTHVLVSVGGGLVRMFPCKARRASTVAGKRIARANKHKDFEVPLLPDDVVAPIVRQIVDLGAPEEYLELSDAEMEAGNTMTLKAQARSTPLVHGMDAAIPQAEIESSAPYQPFHTDRRVVLCEYSRGGTAAQLESASVLLANTTLEDQPSSKKKKKKRLLVGDLEPSEATATSAWAFGQDIPTVKIDLGLPLGPDDDGEAGPDDHLALPPSAMERVMQYGDGDGEQIVVTTRRRRGVRQADPDEDGFFEDDCEVLDFADQRV